MTEPQSIDWVDLLATLATPLVIAILGWLFLARQKKNELQAARYDSLRIERLEVYQTILEPFVIAFIADAVWDSDPNRRGKTKESLMIEKIHSSEFRRAAFQMSFVGTDQVVRAYNAVMQSAFRGDLNGTSAVLLLAQFLLEVRRSAGNEDTKLESVEMLAGIITDIENVRNPDPLRPEGEPPGPEDLARTLLRPGGKRKQEKQTKT